MGFPQRLSPKLYNDKSDILLYVVVLVEFIILNYFVVHTAAFENANTNSYSTTAAYGSVVERNGQWVKNY